MEQQLADQLKDQQILKIKYLEDKIQSLQEEIKLIMDFHDRLDDL